VEKETKNPQQLIAWEERKRGEEQSMGGVITGAITGV
jgi:hypothetical protein